jgi:hypothetical protein
MSFLFHVTELNSLKSILEDDYLKSYSLVKLKNTFSKKHLENSSQGSGLYTKNKFVYFSCTDRLFDKRVLGPVVLYFDPKLLSNRVFYIAAEHIIDPQNNKEQATKYPAHYKNIDKVLSSLYKNSLQLPDGRSLQVFQLIAILNKVQFSKYIIAIEIRQLSRRIKNKKEIKAIENIIKKYLPNVKIFINLHHD